MEETRETQQPSADRRRYGRMAVHWAGEVATREETADCTVLDISPGGAKLQSASPLLPATAMVLKLQHGGEFSGQVAWQQGSVMGVVFAGEASGF